MLPLRLPHPLLRVQRGLLAVLDGHRSDMISKNVFGVINTIYYSGNRRTSSMSPFNVVVVPFGGSLFFLACVCMGISMPPDLLYTVAFKLLDVGI